MFAVRNVANERVVYVKKSDLDTIAFAPGPGTPFIWSDIDLNINSPTSTKQCIADSMGLMVLASDPENDYYLHNFESNLSADFVNRQPVLSVTANPMLNEGDTLVIPVTATDPDGDILTLSAAQLPAFASFVDSVNGHGVLTLQPGFFDAGEYPDVRIEAVDNGTPQLRKIQKLTISVVNTNRPPLAHVDSDTTDEDKSLILNVLQNDVDPDFDPLRVVELLTATTQGSVSILVGDSLVRYIPMPDSSGNDVFGYVVGDGSGGLDTATVQLFVRPLNDVPVLALPDSLVFTGGDSLNLALWPLSADVETPDSLLAFSAVAVPDTLQISLDAATGQLWISAKNSQSQVTVALVVTVDDGDGGTTSDTVTIRVNSPVGIDNILEGLPLAYRLDANYPNPFNPSTTIRFALPNASRVLITVHTVLGQNVATLLNEPRSAGLHNVGFDGKGLASGVYFYSISAIPVDGNGHIGFHDVRRMLLLK